MGVHGLWRLIEPSGKPVPVESLENKILAVDVSIWLHQAIKGFQDAKGAPAVNAHLLGIFHRVCKLLYFKVKPVFVFDGGVPTLKRETIAKRNKLKHKNISEADKIQKQLLNTLMKHSAVSKVLADKAKDAIAASSSTKSGKTSGSDDLFKLPTSKLDSTTTSSDEEEDQDSSETDSGSPTKHWNLHNIDTKSEHFKQLPADVRHEILTDLKETRKQSSWGRLHELPTKSDDFSGFQMNRLLKRQEVQIALEEAEKEMGGHTLSLGELEEILKDQGVISKNTMGNRIASDENTRYLYIKDVKQALEKARLHEENKLASMKQETEIKDELEDEKIQNNKMETLNETSNKADLELEKNLQEAIALSLQDQPSSSGYVQKKKLSDYSFLENFKDEDFESEDSDDQLSPKIKLTSAQNYMMEYSGLNPNEIAKIIANNAGKKPVKRKLIELPNKNNEGKMDAKTNKLEVDAKKCDKNSETTFEDKRPPDLSEPEMKRSKLLENSNVEKINNSENLKISNVSDEAETECFKEVEDSTGIIMIKQMNQEESSSVKTKSHEVVVMSGSEESEDDFDEVEDMSIENLKVEDEKVLQIKIETEEFAEVDDLFADIFIPKIETEQKNKQKEESKLSETQKIEESTINRIDEEIQVISETPDEPKLPNEKPEVSEVEKIEQLKIDENSRSKLTDEELIKMKDSLSKQQLELRNEQGLRERLGTNITDQMYKEAQDLLELFGLPYIVAPMEAEAQCAFLELASLTDGTITDDSDIWLFGGKTVYKNFFNQSKHVLEYRAEDIKHYFKLSREQMILLALLVGSDYTTGLQGVGPVTALEILAAFPSSNTSFMLSHDQLLIGLSEFKSWFKQGTNFAKGKSSLRNKLKNVIFTDGFPSAQVVQAYLNPTVDTNEEKFSWSKPDFEGLTDFGKVKFGWSRTKTENILKPVIKKMKESKYQSTLLNYFKVKHNLNAEEAQKLMSERVKSAVKRIGQDPNEVEDDVNPEEEKLQKSKRTKKSDPENLDRKDFKERRPNVKKTEKSHSQDIENEIKKNQGKGKIAKIQNNHDLKHRKRYVKKPDNSLMVENKDETKQGKGKSKYKKKGLIEKESELLSDNEEFIDVDKLEALLESVEKQAEISKNNNKKNKKISNRSRKKPDTESVQQTPAINVADTIGIKPNNKSNESIERHDNIHIASKCDENSVYSGCVKEEKIEGNITDFTMSIYVQKENNDVPLKIDVKDNPEMNTFKYVSELVKGKYVAKETEKEKTQRTKPKSTGKQKTKKLNCSKVSISHLSDKLDDELKLLEQTEALSEKRIEDIKEEAEKKLKQELNKKTLITRKLHRKEIIPQRERDQKNVMRTRLRAIEVFRKSNIDPSSKKVTGHKVRTAKDDACLSESSSDSDL